MKNKKNILFNHFPIDNNRIESKTLPDYFSSMGHNVYSVFEKTGNKNRRFYSLHAGVNQPVIRLEKSELQKIEFDLSGTQ